MNKAIVLGIALVLLAACSSGDGDSEDATPSPTETPDPIGVLPTVAPTATPEPMPTPEPDTLALGESVIVGSGGRLTVHGYESGFTSGNQFIPTPSYEFASVDVEGCAPAQIVGGDRMSLNPDSFELQMPDNTRRTTDFEIRDPALSYTELLANDCVRGFITFQVPVGVKPLYVVFSGSSIVKWRIQ